MNRLGMLFILIALIISLILTVFVYKNQKNKMPGQAQLNVSVLIATKSLSRGTTIKSGDVEWKPWPRAALSSQFIIQGAYAKEDIIGSVVRESLSVGQPVNYSMLIAKANLSPLASILEPEMHAYTIDVSLSAALAGLLVPGDVVDVILTHARSDNEGGQSSKSYISRTILRNINVLAVDQDLTPVPSISKTSGRSMGNANTRNVTLEVAAKQAEILALSKSMGSLTLSLSSLANASSVKSLPLTSTDAGEFNAISNENTFNEIVLFHGDKVDQDQRSNRY